MDRARLQQSQPSVLDRLAQGFQMGMQKQQMDLQRRQLEAKANEARKLDLENMATGAIYKVAMGQPLSPQEQAAVDAYSVMKNTGVTFDPVTKEYINQPSLSQRVAGLSGNRLGLNEPQMQIGGPALEDRIQTGYGDPLEANQRAAAARAQELGGYNPYATFANSPQLDQTAMDMMAAEDASPKVKGPLAGTRAAQEMEAQASMELQKEQYKQALTTKKEREDQAKGKEQLNETLGKMYGYISDIESEGGGIKTGGGLQLKNYLAATDIGKEIGKASGSPTTQKMVMKDSLKRLLVPQIMKATGMSAKQIDSNAELKSYLDALSSDTTSIETQKEVLKNISDIFGEGKIKLPENKKPSSIDPTLLEFMTPEERKLF